MEDYEQKSSPNILFLPGIDIDEYVSIEDKANEKLLEIINVNNEPLYEYSIYNKNDIKFLSNEKWPSLTNLHCWYCDFTFDGNFVFIPTHIKECPNGGLEFGVRGYMCTFNCAMSIILSTTSHGSAERWKYINNLKILYFIKNGVHVSYIKAAPCKYNLKKYGGEWTNEKFWEELKNLDIYGGLKDHTIKPENERIHIVFNELISKHNKNIRIIDDNEDCAIYYGNRILLSKNSIWANEYKKNAISSIMDEESTKCTDLSCSSLSCTPPLESPLSNSLSLDNEFNEFIAKELFGEECN